MISIDIEHKLIGDIYDAGLEPKLWPQVLQQISEHWQSYMANFVVGDQLNPNGHIVIGYGVSDAVLNLYYEGGFTKLDMEMAFKWFQYGNSKVGITHANHKLFGSIENFIKESGDLYTNFQSVIGSKYQMGTVLDFTDYRYAIAGFHRHPEEQPFSDEEVAVAQRLMPHIRRSLQIHRQLTHVRQQNAQLYRMFDKMVAGVLLLDVNGRVCYGNAAAETLLSKKDILNIIANVSPNLKAANKVDDANLDVLIQGAIKTGLRERNSLQTNERCVGGVMRLTNKNGDKSLMLTITPLSEMSGYEDLRSDGIAAGVFITDPNAPRVLARTILQQSYLLNERECDICEAFLNNASLEGVAETLGFTLSTVRSYIRDIFLKTNQHSQVELMKLLMGLTLDFEHIR